MNRNTEQGLKEADSVVEIDDLKLGLECRNLPHQYLRYGNLANDARRDVDEAKADLELTEAEVAVEVRNAHQGEKLTESAIKELIAVHKRVQAKAKVLRDRQHEMRQLDVVVSALEQKKKSLQGLIDLHGMQYFAEPKSTPEARESIDRQERRNVFKSIPRDEWQSRRRRE